MVQTLGLQLVKQTAYLLKGVASGLVKDSQLHIRITAGSKLAYFYFHTDVAYIIGGSDQPDDVHSVSYEVMTVNLRTGEVSEVEDTLFGTNLPGVAASRNRIAVCGGRSGSTVLKYCQMYSPKEDPYAKFTYLALFHPLARTQQKICSC